VSLATEATRVGEKRKSPVHIIQAEALKRKGKIKSEKQKEKKYTSPPEKGPGL